MTKPLETPNQLDKIEHLQQQMWLVASISQSNPLGYKLLDAHIEALKRIVNEDYTSIKEKLEAIEEVLHA